MPEIPDRINGEIIEAAHINTNRDRTIQRYTSASNRDSLMPLPVTGDTGWLDDVNQLTIYDGSSWTVVSGQGVYLPLVGGTLSGILNVVISGITSILNSTSLILGKNQGSGGTSNIDFHSDDSSLGGVRVGRIRGDADTIYTERNGGSRITLGPNHMFVSGAATNVRFEGVALFPTTSQPANIWIDPATGQMRVSTA